MHSSVVGAAFSSQRTHNTSVEKPYNSENSSQYILEPLRYSICYSPYDINHQSAAHTKAEKKEQLLLYSYIPAEGRLFKTEPHTHTKRKGGGGRYCPLVYVEF